MREGVYIERNHQTARVERRFVVVVILLIALLIWRNAIAGGPEEQVCDVNADYALGSEDFLQAIRLHRDILRKSPNDALAQYILDLPKSDRQLSAAID